MRLFLISLAISTIATAASADRLCVRNGADEPRFFAVETVAGARKAGPLGPDGSLCLDDPQAGGGVVSVFEHDQALEGCSRLVEGAETEALLRYADFDRCEWSSHH